MEQMKLDDILKGVERPELTKADAPAPATETKAEPAAPEPAKAEAPQSNTSIRRQHRDKEQAAHGRERDPATGQYAPKTETKEAPKEEAKKEEPKTEAKAEPKAEPKEELTPKEKAFLRAAEEERRKRQDLERRLAEATTTKQPDAKTEKKTFWDDPEGFLADQQQQFQGAIVRTRLETSEAIARSRYPDYQANLNQFIEITKTNPALYQQMLQSPDPAEYVYRMAKNHKELADVGNLDAFKKRVEDETRVKVEAEVREKMKKEDEVRKATVAALPGSLSNVTGASNGASARPSWGGPTSLDNILKP